MYNIVVIQIVYSDKPLILLFWSPKSEPGEFYVLHTVYNVPLKQLGCVKDLTFLALEGKQEDLNLQALEFDYQLVLKIQDLVYTVLNCQLYDCK